MKITFTAYQPDEAEQLIDFITGEQWTFFVNSNPSREKVQGWLDKGMYAQPENLVFWIVVDDQRAGFIRAHDLPQWPGLDFRISASYRGRGVGSAALRWITDHLFTLYPEMLRLEGQTRFDNLAMRATFRRCGYVKEAHYRCTWPNEHDQRVDGIGYSILRRDWESGTTTPVNWNDE